MKNLIVVTGGAGFVGSNLIELLIKKTKKKIISLLVELFNFQISKFNLFYPI